LNNRIIPYLGAYKLNKITPSVLTAYFNEAKTWKTMYKPPRKNIPVSKATVEKVYEIITAILEKAFEWELIASNPCKKVKLQLDNMESEINKNKEKGEKKEIINSYTKDEYKRVLELIKNEDKDKMVLIETALKTGFSKEELFGLRWKDFDEENATLSVRVVRLYSKNRGIIEKQPKARSRIRTISIPNSLVQTLKSFKNDSDANEDYIFRNINMNSIGSWFNNFQKRNNIRKIRFHDLRHTHATILLFAGVDIKTISKRLGHSNIGITMDTYTDVLHELDVSASQKLDEI
jgi:integrase